LKATAATINAEKPVLQSDAANPLQLHFKFEQHSIQMSPGHTANSEL
jgi:hypothetical protein